MRNTCDAPQLDGRVGGWCGRAEARHMDAQMGGTDARARTRGGARMRAGEGGVQAAWDFQ